VIEIYYQYLSKDALDNLLLEVITRESTDYGQKEVAVADKKRQLLEQLERGEACILYSSKEGYCTIVSREEKQQLFAHSEAH
jgi:uncharacterized protein